jgi:hypothetical protein
MTYNKKLAVLLAIIAALALAYTLGIVFEPERAGSRSAAYTWLDPKLADRIDRITISASGNVTELTRKNNEWFVLHNGSEYPARRLRVEDLVNLLTKRAPYPVRSSNAASHERLGLTEDAAARITVSGGGGAPSGGAPPVGAALLDLLVGQGDNTGREVYLRRQGQNEVRSGEDNFTAYVSGSRASWYKLRLFPESESGSLDVDGVQRFTVYTPGTSENGADAATRVFTRNGREWTFGGMNVKEADMSKVDAYLRGILTAEGDDFSDSVGPDDPMFKGSRITLELGNGEVRTIRLSPADETGRRFALVSGSPHVYSLAGWTAERLFRDDASFEKQ